MMIIGRTILLGIRSNRVLSALRIVAAIQAKLAETTCTTGIGIPFLLKPCFSVFASEGVSEGEKCIEWST